MYLMKIVIRARPGARQAYVKRIEEEGLFGPTGSGKGKGGAARFVVAVKEPAVDGRANRAIEKALAEYLGVTPSRVRIVAGHSAKEKTVEIS